MSTTMSGLPLSPVEGYPKLACHMGKHPECLIYRRFGSLNSQNLLYLQAELIHLEQKLRRLEKNDLSSAEGNRSNYSKDWYWLSNSELEGNNAQLETVLAIRSKLAEYNNAVIQQNTMSRLADPDHYHLRSLQDWMGRPSMGNYDLIGKDRDTWGSVDEPLNPHADLFAVASDIKEKDDAFSIWVSQKFFHWFYKIFGHPLKKPDDIESGIISYKTETLQKFTSYITTLVASLLPLLAIIILYFVGSINTRLGIIGLFTVVFTTCLSFFTSVSKGEIFIATSTFAAVQVVFVSANNGDCTCNT